MTDNLFQAQAELDQRQWAEINNEREQRIEEALIECLARGVSEKSMNALFSECGIKTRTQIQMIDASLAKIKSPEHNMLKVVDDAFNRLIGRN